MLPRCLAVHGYEIFPDGRFSKLLERTCRLVARVHHQYDCLILLGGQHLHGVSTTIDLQMELRLLELGVPGDKLRSWSRLCPDQRPPRDTMEEVDLLPHLLRVLGRSPERVTIHVVAIWYFRPRIMFLLKNRGARCGKFHGAFSLDPKRMLIEAVAYLVTRRWPHGNAPIFHQNRAARDVFPSQPSGWHWQDNTPDAWSIPARR